MLSLILLSMSWLGPGRAEAQPKCADAWPRDGLNLAGRLEDGDIRAFMDVGYPARSASGVSGVFIYPSRWQPGGQAEGTAEFSLEGALTDDCQMELTDSANAVWRLKFVAGEPLVGTRQVPGGRAVPVTLRIVPPIDCSGSGVWRRFASPRWPITFDYPASWRFAETGINIAIECPDPARLAWGGAPILLQMGQGRIEIVADDGRRAARIEGFITFGNNQWLVGDTCEERRPDDLGPFCMVARQSTWRGMTVLQGSAGEHRRYRSGGGYVGQGGGIMSYLFLIGDTWVALNSLDSPPSIDTLGSSGPVLFEGTGVTERLVRSIRRR